MIRFLLFLYHYIKSSLLILRKSVLVTIALLRKEVKKTKQKE